MLKHPLVLVTFACIYLGISANCGSTTPSRAKTEASDYTNDVPGIAVSEARRTSENSKYESSDDLNSATASGLQEYAATSSSTVLKRTTTDVYPEPFDFSDLEPTYISLLEKFLKGILISTNVIDSAAGKIGDAISKIPVVGTIENQVGRVVRGFSDVLNLASSEVKAVFPGTYWCGAGDDAPNEDDLGLFHRTDSCCREHDSCKLSILAGDHLQKLLNNGVFTRSHCSCDSEFYNCLKNTSTIISSKIGATYFNVLSPQCFQEDYPVECNKYESIWYLHRKCLDYNRDYTGKKSYQWFDNPRY